MEISCLMFWWKSSQLMNGLLTRKKWLRERTTVLFFATITLKFHMNLKLFCLSMAVLSLRKEMRVAFLESAIRISRTWRNNQLSGWNRILLISKLRISVNMLTGCFWYLKMEIRGTTTRALWWALTRVTDRSGSCANHPSSRSWNQHHSLWWAPRTAMDTVIQPNIPGKF